MLQGTDMSQTSDLQAFERARPKLLGLAYRILGSLADAEDAVQDTFVKWTGADRRRIDNPAAWLTTACTRRCLDLLRAAHRTRVDYVGAWLPEPVQSAVEADSDGDPDLSTSLTTAFLLLLERLTPKERAAYLLREIFDVPYPEIATTLELGESACRKLVSRARAHVDRAKVRHATPPDRQSSLLSAFQAAVTSGDTAPLAALLSSEIRLSTDGGGRVPALLDILQGKEAVGDFLSGSLRRYWEGFQWRPVDINGAGGFVLEQEGRTVAAVSFAYDPAGLATDIYIMRNPDKLARLGAIAVR